MTDGQLHNDTALGLIEVIDEEKNEYVTVVRRPIDYLTSLKRIEAIRDPNLRISFCREFKSGGKDAVRNLAHKKGIRRVRCVERKQIISIKDKPNEHGKIYKGYQGGSNWGMEIYEYPQGHKKKDKWKGVVISRFDANQPGFKPGTTRRPAPTARLVMRLQINDCVEIEGSDKRKIMRLQKMAQSGTLCFSPVNEANVADRDQNKNVMGTYKNKNFTGKIEGREPNKQIKITKLGGKKVDRTVRVDDPELTWNYEDDFNFDRLRPSSLKALNPRKVHISPTGKINYEARRKPRQKS